MLFDEWGLSQANPVDMPLVSGSGTSDETAYERAKREPMSIADAKRFRRAAARFNYMSLDRPDLGVVANRLSQLMAAPRVGDETLI